MKKIHAMEKQVESENAGGSSGSMHDITADRAAQALVQRKKQRAMTQALSPGKQIAMVSWTATVLVEM